MPKATLIFNLPVKQDDFEYAQNGIDYSIVLDDLDSWLRAKLKYQDQENISIEEVRKKLWDLKNERNLK